MLPSYHHLLPIISFWCSWKCFLSSLGHFFTLRFLIQSLPNLATVCILFWINTPWTFVIQVFFFASIWKGLCIFRMVPIDIFHFSFRYDYIVLSCFTGSPSLIHFFFQNVKTSKLAYHLFKITEIYYFEAQHTLLPPFAIMKSKTTTTDSSIYSTNFYLLVNIRFGIVNPCSFFHLLTNKVVNKKGHKFVELLTFGRVTFLADVREVYISHCQNYELL